MSAHPKPKPRRKPGIRVLRDGREVCSPAQWAKRRLEVGKAADWLCAKCGQLVGPDEGEAHHVHGRGLGGGKRDDRAAIWLCIPCHRKHHVPTKVIPGKEAVIGDIRLEDTVENGQENHAPRTLLEQG